MLSSKSLLIKTIQNMTNPMCLLNTRRGSEWKGNVQEKHMKVNFLRKDGDQICQNGAIRTGMEKTSYSIRDN